MDGRLLANGFTQTHRRPSSAATGFIWLRKRLVAQKAAKASFEDDHLHRVSSQTQILLDSPSAIMDGVRLLSTMGAHRALAFGDDLHAQASICLPFLGHDAKFWQIQWHHDSFLWDFCFCIFSGILICQGFVLLFLALVFLPSSTKNMPLPFLLSFSPTDKLIFSPSRTETRISSSLWLPILVSGRRMRGSRRNSHCSSSVSAIISWIAQGAVLL